MKVTLRGSAANALMASLFVDQHGAAAVEYCCGPMLEAVKAEIERRGLDSSATPAQAGEEESDAN